MRKPLKPGENPRETLSNHRERGPQVLTYTRRDLTELFGVADSTLHHWVTAGRLDPASLTSICELWHDRQAGRP